MRQIPDEVYHDLLNLLAVIHRDGGHHTGEVGVAQSIKDAEKKVVELRYKVLND